MPHIRIRFDPISQQSRSQSVITIRIDSGSHLVSISARPRQKIPHPRQLVLSERSHGTTRSVTTIHPPNTAGDSPSGRQHHNAVVDGDSVILIPKPRGEPGRPRSGGYNLQEQLTGWTTGFYNEIKVFCFADD